MDGLTIAIATYGRESVLIQTLDQVLALRPGPHEIVVVDQTPRHEDDTERRLNDMADSRAIRWLRLLEPSIPRAMNLALREARWPIVLFVDDDVVPTPALIGAHAGRYADPSTWAVVGQVLQPGQSVRTGLPERQQAGFRRDLGFPFNCDQPAYVENVIACNLSLRRDRAIEIGGFDENFVRVGYRFETEFARRLCRAGGRIAFEPTAGIRHLAAPRGGTRAHASRLTSPRPDHSVGDYYFALLHATGLDRIGYITERLVRSWTTRYHLRHPWYIPPKIVGEVRGLAMAARLARHGPRLMQCAGGPIQAVDEKGRRA